MSDTRFVDLMPRFHVPLAIYLYTQLGSCADICFINSTSLVVCHNARIHQHRMCLIATHRG